jgi:hypothetical protein
MSKLDYVFANDECDLTFNGHDAFDGTQKIPCAWWMTSQLGTPRGRYDEYSS